MFGSACRLASNLLFGPAYITMSNVESEEDAGANRLPVLADDNDAVPVQGNADVVDEAAEEAAREQLRREREARAQALTLEIVGDLPYAEVKPPENVLFVCKLNPVTEGQSQSDSNLNQYESRITIL